MLKRLTIDSASELEKAKESTLRRVDRAVVPVRPDAKYWRPSGRFELSIARRSADPPARESLLAGVAKGQDMDRISRMSEKDYVLGTHDEELVRLGLQHRVWRPMVLDCWQRAGITVGKRVLDLGAGPGYASIDLAEIIGPTGEVVGGERSARVLEAARRDCAERGLSP